MQPPNTPELRSLLALFQRPPWHARAACRGMGTDLFFPAQGGRYDEALAICAGCPVIEECAEVGMGESDGVWGGMSGRERRRSTRQGAA